MSARRARLPRISDGDEDDLAEAYMRDDWEDMHHVAQEQTQSSPPGPSLPVIPAQEMRPPSVNSTRTSRSSSRSSQQEAYAKIHVHRDEPTISVPRRDRKESEVQNGQAKADMPIIARKANTTIKHARPISDTPVSPVDRFNPSRSSSHAQREPPHETELGHHNTSISTQPATRLHIVQQLQLIATEREALVEKLQTINNREHGLLIMLSEMETAANTPQQMFPSQEENMIPPYYASELNPNIFDQAPRIPETVHGTPIRQPHKQSKDKPRARPVSAPPQGTPNGTGQRTPSTSKRIPLADKTEESLAMFDSTPIFPAIVLSTSLMDDGLSVSASMSTPKRSPAKSQIPQRAKSCIVPVRLGDIAEAGKVEGTKDRPSTPHGKIPRKKSQSTVSRIEVATPGMGELDAVLSTVIQQKWEF